MTYARQVAEHVAALGGPDFRHLNDEELIKIINQANDQICEALKKATVSIDQANKALQQFGEAAGKLKETKT